MLLDVPEVPEVPELIDPLPEVEDWSEALEPLLELADSEDWSLVAPWDVDDDGFVVVDCWSAFAPLVTLCEPLPTFTPGLTSAPTFAFELLTPTFASTPTLGLTLSDLDEDPAVLLEDGLVAELP